MDLVSFGRMRRGALVRILLGQKRTLTLVPVVLQNVNLENSVKPVKICAYFLHVRIWPASYRLSKNALVVKTHVCPTNIARAWPPYLMNIRDVGQSRFVSLETVKL